MKKRNTLASRAAVEGDSVESAGGLEGLRPLLDARPNGGGEYFMENFRGGKAICLSCGALDDMIMMATHKKNCPWKAFWRALEALRSMLEGPALTAPAIARTAAKRMKPSKKRTHV